MDLIACLFSPSDPRVPRSDRPRCGAKTRKGTRCQAPAVWDEQRDKPMNGRCKLHGGLSTGAKTEEGRRSPSSLACSVVRLAVLPYATLDGDLVTVHNIRNFDYRSETDFTPAYYDKTFDLNKLQAVDLVAVYWMGPDIAHIFVSFGFGDGDHVAVSIETRKEVGEGYSTLKGFFKQYELFYVVADERNVIRVRTNYRTLRRTYTSTGSTVPARTDGDYSLHTFRRSMH